MKSAKEMFEALGYKLVSKQWYLCYERENDYGGIDVVTFLDMGKTIDIYSVFPIDKHISNKSLTLEELQAINKQVEELKWKVEEWRVII